MADLTGKWNITVHTFMGDQFSTHDYTVADGALTGTVTDGANGSVAEIRDGKSDGTTYECKFTIKAAIGEMEFTLNGALQEDGTIKGTSSNAMGSFDYDGVRA